MKQPKKSDYDHGTDQEQLNRYRLLIENVQDYAIFLLDPDGKVASWNLGAERFKGYRPSEIVGKYFSTFYTPEDIRNNKPTKELEEAKSAGRVEDEGWRVRKDGTRFWANVVITALYDEVGQHKGFAKVTRDLTERKMYEVALEEANHKLETSLGELQLLNVSKDDFVSLASHQLRTPATGVKQYLALLLDGYMGPLTERQMDCLQKAYDSNDRQLAIVNDLLAVAQLDAGKVILKKTATDICDLIENIVDEQADKFKTREQRVNLDLPQQPVIIEVDSGRLRMVLENLIDNASKYTPQKGEITVSTARIDGEQRISVADTGIGIDKKEISKIFEKFTRISNPLTQNITGSGLGLYWVDKIIQLHNGRIDVESGPRAGTVFNVFIPAEATNA